MASHSSVDHDTRDHPTSAPTAPEAPGSADAKCTAAPVPMVGRPAASPPLLSGPPAPPAAPNLLGLLSLPVRPKLEVGSTTDPEEREADVAADQVLDAPPRGEPDGLPAPLPGGSSPPAIHTILDGPAHPGRPLPTSARRFFEPRLGYDLGTVRIHTGSAAGRAARRIGARAFTAGQHIYFADGHFSPATSEGRRLLAHELIHVLQDGPQVRRTPGDGSSEGPSEPQETQVVAIRRAVVINRVMSADEFLVEVIRQYRGLSLEDARAEAADWHWVNPPEPVTERDVRRGFRLVNIRDRTQTLQPSTGEERSERARSFRGLPREVQGRLNQEADDRFWESTNYRPGERLGDSPADRAMADTWLRYRDQVTREHLELAALPEDVRAALFDPYAVERPDPADYPQLLRIARRLQELTPAQIRDYRHRVNAVTDDLDRLEASVERFIGSLGQREDEAAEYRTIETRLYNLEDLYHLVERVRVTERLARLPSSDEYGVEDTAVTGARAELPGLREQLVRALEQNGFESRAAFDAALETYLERFTQQARTLAFDMLARGDHELFEHQRRYEQTAAAEQLHQRIQASEATEEHERGWAEARSASRIGGRATRSNWQEVLEEQRPHSRASGEAFRASQGEFEDAIGDDVLAGRVEGQQRVGLITATNPATVRTIMLEYIASKREAIAETQANLADDPELIFELDQVLTAAYEQLGIRPGSIYDMIIRDHMSEVSIEKAIVSLAKAAFALIAAIAGGIIGGPVGAGAALLAFGIGVEEAVTQFREWEVRSEAHEAGLLSEDPSFGWVILAVVGAGLDLAGAVAAVRAMRPAVEAFNASGDLARLERALSELAEVDARVQANVLRAARAERQFDRAVEGLLATSGRLNAAVVPGLEEFARLVQIAYYGARRGIIRFERYLLELKARGLIDDIDALTGAPLQRYKEAFEEGVSEYHAEVDVSGRRIADEPPTPSERPRPTRSQGQRTGTERPSPLRTPEEGPRPGETGMQYERRVFRETPLARASRAYRGWRGGSRGSFETWWNGLPQRVRRSFGSDITEVERRAQQVMAENTDQFVSRSSNQQLRTLWSQRQQMRDEALATIQTLRREQAAHPVSSAEFRSLERRIQAQTARVDEINAFEIGRVGNRRPDQIELFPEEGRAVVTDITLRLNDRWHNFKTLLYREVVRDITRWDDVFAIEFRTARQQILFD